MKVLPLLALGAFLSVGVVAHAVDPVPTPSPAHAHKHGAKRLTPEQKALLKEIAAKYDTNKDGRLSRLERARISAEDKAKLEKAGLPVGGKKAKGKAAKKGR